MGVVLENLIPVPGDATSVITGIAIVGFSVFFVILSLSRLLNRGFNAKFGRRYCSSNLRSDPVGC